MTPHNTSEPIQGAAPDLAALRARAAARSPEWHALRQTRLDSSEVALATMALGEEYLARGDLDTARSWFEMAAIHQAPDAHARLATVAVLADAVRDADIVSAAEGTELAVEQHDPHHERDTAVGQLEAAADLLRTVKERAARIVADAKDRAEQILANAQAESEAVAHASRDHVPDVVWVPGHTGSYRRSTVYQVKYTSDMDITVDLVPSLGDMEPAPHDVGDRLRAALRLWIGGAGQGPDRVKVWDVGRPTYAARRLGSALCTPDCLSRVASVVCEEPPHHQFQELVLRLLAWREALDTATDSPKLATVPHRLPGEFPLKHLWVPQSTVGGGPTADDQPSADHQTQPCADLTSPRP